MIAVSSKTILSRRMERTRTDIAIAIVGGIAALYVHPLVVSQLCFHIERVILFSHFNIVRTTMVLSPLFPQNFFNLEKNVEFSGLAPPAASPDGCCDTPFCVFNIGEGLLSAIFSN
jgi:hypothetical protein